MKDDHDKEFVISILRNSGLQVQPIPELHIHKIPTPDLRVRMPEGNIIVEVRSKTDDQQLRDLLESPKGTPLCYKVSTLETCIRNEWDQIRKFPDRDEANFTLFWFITRKVGGITVLTNSFAMGLLYGTELLQGFKVDRKGFYQKGCFFFRESIFFSKKKCKDLDGVVLHDVQSIKLCLNPFSPRYSSFKHTMFADLFRVQFAVVDPVEMEAANECFIADCSVDREDKNGIVRYLKSKYGLDTVKIIRFVPFNYPLD